MIAHWFWLYCAEKGIGVTIERVESTSNVADELSWGQYKLLRALGAAWMPPQLPDEIYEPRRLVYVAPELGG